MLDACDLAILAMCSGGVDLPKDVADDEGIYLEWVDASVKKLTDLGYLGCDESMTQAGVSLMAKINGLLEAENV